MGELARARSGDARSRIARSASRLVVPGLRRVSLFIAGR